MLDWDGVVEATSNTPVRPHWLSCHYTPFTARADVLLNSVKCDLLGPADELIREVAAANIFYLQWMTRLV